MACTQQKNKRAESEQRQALCRLIEDRRLMPNDPAQGRPKSLLRGRRARHFQQHGARPVREWFCEFAPKRVRASRH